MEFLVHFELDDNPQWIPFSQDLSGNQAFLKYCEAIPCLQLLLMDSKRAEQYVQSMNKLPITEIKVGDIFYLDIRIYTDEWVESLQLDRCPFTNRYVAAATYKSFNPTRSLVKIDIPIFKTSITFGRIHVLWYGRTSIFDEKKMILVNEDLLQRYPHINQG